MAAITIQHTKEALSRAVILAIMARAGLNLAINQEFDYGIDCTIHRLSPSRPGGRRAMPDGFPIDFQLKSTVNWEAVDDEIVYEMEIDTWNDLIGRHPSGVPFYLGLLCLPRDETLWLSCEEAALTIRRCCYFMRPSGKCFSDNRRSYTVRIPRRNMLTPASLMGLLDDARASAMRRV